MIPGMEMETLLGGLSSGLEATEESDQEPEDSAVEMSCSQREGAEGERRTELLRSVGENQVSKEEKEARGKTGRTMLSFPAGRAPPHRACILQAGQGQATHIWHSHRCWTPRNDSLQGS